MKATPPSGTILDRPTVELGTTEDIPALECIVRDSFEHPWSTRLLLGAVRNRHYDVHVIRGLTQDAVAVTITHTVLSNSNLDMLAVATAERGQGMGRYLTECWIERSRERGLAQLTLQVNYRNREARGLYESMGFHLERLLAEYYPNGDTAFDMRLRI